MKKIATITMMFFLVLFLSIKLFAQLPTTNNPLYTHPVVNAELLPKFVNPLPIIERQDITAGGNITIYIGEGLHDFGLNPSIPTNTKVWGYSVDQNVFDYLGPTLVAMENKSVNVHYVNKLGYEYPLPLDNTLHWAFAEHNGMDMYNIATNGIPIVPHLHGGDVESVSDGKPEAWWTPNGTKGLDFIKDVYNYENKQDASTYWFHDHTLGLTRTNVYMGLAAFYLLRDNNELKLIRKNKIPSGTHEIEMVIQDKMFNGNGQLAIPDIPAEFVEGFRLFDQSKPSIQPEFFGEVILVNGKAWPYLEVEPVKYRFRILNGSDSRFYRMKLTSNDIQDIKWNVIGSDQGFLENVSPINELLIAPGERYDVVIDFSNPALLGKNIIITNDAPAPFPNGDDIPDPNSNGLIMQFKVKNINVVDNVQLPSDLGKPIKKLQSKIIRKLMLSEGMDQYGRMQPMLGIVDENNPNDGTLTWNDPITEYIKNNSTEIWEIYNTTEDAHPIHLHLVRFQILGRQEFEGTLLDKHNMAHDHSMVMGYKLTDIDKIDTEEEPGVYEKGWKDTGILYPEEVTRLIARFDRIGDYVWHCHILSHEDHEMMRKFVVVPTLKKEEDEQVLAAGFNLEQNYPNPFNPVTHIKFNLKENEFTTLKIYDALGNLVKTLLNQELVGGKYDISFDASELANGMYVYQLVSGNNVQSKKMILLK